LEGRLEVPGGKAAGSADLPASGRLRPALQEHCATGESGAALVGLCV